ncbi:MAG: molybdenum cofactor cytidylyltransferase [Halieaceae bacterium]|jgi:molybdenum cofactor cytidylyltransferase
MDKHAQGSRSTELCVLLLAAGSSRRFGVDKRSEFFIPGVSLLEATLNVYLDAKLSVQVCLGVDAVDRALGLQLELPGAQVLHCDHANKGMGATLAEAAGHCAGFSAVIVALADMPLLQQNTLAALCSEASEDRIVFPLYQGRRGHPVVFGRRFIPALRKLQGDRGASTLIRDNPEACVAVAVDDPGVLLDADTPEALRHLRSLVSR